MDDEEAFLDWLWEQYHITDYEYDNLSMYEQEDLWNEFEGYMDLI